MEAETNPTTTQDVNNTVNKLETTNQDEPEPEDNICQTDEGIFIYIKLVT
jgi:hypothetical protein